MPDDDIAPYLRPGPTQEWLLEQMDTGHARAQHAGELGAPSSVQFKARIRSHLQHAPEIYVGTAETGARAFLIVDERANQVAWIAPHKPKRATFFQPGPGAREFVRRKAVGYGPDRWRVADLGDSRTTVQRGTTRGIGSAQRNADRGATARVP